MRLTEAYWNWLQFTEAHCKVFLGDLKNEFSMMKKSHFYSVFNNIFHSKCKMVYTFEAFFGLPSSTGYPKKSTTAVGSGELCHWTPLRKRSGELCHTKRSGELCPAFFSGSGGRSAPEILYSSRPPHSKMTVVCTRQTPSNYHIIIL